MSRTALFDPLRGVLLLGDLYPKSQFDYRSLYLPDVLRRSSESEGDQDRLWRSMPRVHVQRWNSKSGRDGRRLRRPMSSLFRRSMRDLESRSLSLRCLPPDHLSTAILLVTPITSASVAISSCTACNGWGMGTRHAAFLIEPTSPKRLVRWRVLGARSRDRGEYPTRARGVKHGCRGSACPGSAGQPCRHRCEGGSSPPAAPEPLPPGHSVSSAARRIK